jgi:myo-inositol-1(or 4)-monophosphatase
MTRFGSELDLALGTARALGERQMARFEQKYRVVRKELREFVTSIDLECHELALEWLGRAAPVLSEETRTPVQRIPDLCWIVDPLDGSHNFIAGLPNFGVSIALVENGRFVLGVIGIPAFGDTFHAVDGQGALRNDKLIRASTNADLSKAMVAYDNQFHLSPDGFDRYRRVTEAAFTTRILGSAAYDLSLIARGRIDARVFNCAKVFDVAAGIVILREAGGCLTDFAGGPVTASTRDIVASNGLVHDRLLSVLKGERDEQAGAVYGGFWLERDPGGHPRREPPPADVGASGLR